MKFTFVETANVPLDDFEWSRHFRAFVVVLVACLSGSFARGRVVCSRAVMLASCVWFVLNPVATSFFIFSFVCGSSTKGAIFSWMSWAVISKVSSIALVWGWCTEMASICDLGFATSFFRSSISWSGFAE